MEKSMKLYNGATKVIGGFVRALFRVKVIGAENENSVNLTNTVVCANHMSNWDPVILACVTKNPVSFMGKAELFKIPVLGFILRAVGAFPINRGTGDIAAIKMTIDTLKNGSNICLFPQGTRCMGKDPAETEVKSGV
jgi:1-acyl-sn-glycerol-3-phosphate acyltransferase